MIKTIKKGEMTNLVADIPYVQEPIAFYQKYKSNKNSLLLMTAEVNSKKKQKSIILLAASLKITATQNNILLSPLGPNGKNLLSAVSPELERTYSFKYQDDNLCLLLNTEKKFSDEFQRLKEQGPFSPLREILSGIKCLDNKQDFFIAGNFSFDLIETFEELPKVPPSETHCPHYTLYVSELLVEVSHQTQKSRLKASLFGGEFFENSYYDISRKMQSIQKETLKDSLTLPSESIAIPAEQNYQVDISDSEFAQKVMTIKDKIIDGDIFQAVLSRTFTMKCPDALQAFAHLVELNPSPYMFFMQDQDFSLFGASPESALKYNADERKVEIYPIAGTRKRHINQFGKVDRELDGRVELEMRMNHKEVAEHIMLVDLARNDIAKISKPGSSFVDPLMKVDRYQRVMHLVSQVQGTLREDLDALHAYQATMNMGTLTGAPKISAISIVRTLEGKDRGPYGGGVGYINGRGDMDTCIVIRSAFVKNNLAHVQAGAGIVYDSDPIDEAQETRDKAYSVLKALGAGDAHV